MVNNNCDSTEFWDNRKLIQQWKEEFAAFATLSSEKHQCKNASKFVSFQGSKPIKLLFVVLTIIFLSFSVFKDLNCLFAIIFQNREKVALVILLRTVGSIIYQHKSDSLPNRTICT